MPIPLITINNILKSSKLRYKRVVILKKERPIIKILEGIRKEIKENPNNDFNEFLNNFNGSVNDTRRILEHNKIRDSNESKEMDFYEDIQSEIQPINSIASKQPASSSDRVSAFRPVAMDTTPLRRRQHSLPPTRLRTNLDEAPQLPEPSNKSSGPPRAVSSRPPNYPLFIVDNVDNPGVKKGKVTEIIGPSDSARRRLFNDDQDIVNIVGQKRPTPTNENDDQSRRVSPRVGTFRPISKGGKNKRKTRKKRN